MKLQSFIPEIKIQPNSQPRDLKQLSWFVEINRAKICDETYEVFKEYDEEGYKTVLDSVKENGIIKIDNETHNCVMIKDNFTKTVLLIFLPGEYADEYFYSDDYTRCDINVNGIKLVTGIY